MNGKARIRNIVNQKGVSAHVGIDNRATMDPIAAIKTPI